MFVSLVIVFVFLSVLTVKVVFADSPGGTDCSEGQLCNPLGADSIGGVIQKIIEALRDYIGPPILTLMVLYGAFQMLFAGGEPEKFATGRKTILYAVIGYAIILLASGIEFIIKDLLRV